MRSAPSTTGPIADMRRSASERRTPRAWHAWFSAAAVGCAAAALVLSWQVLRVRHSYGGDWSALFCTGSTRPIPPELEREHLHRFRGTPGFDGQLYHYIAHAPFDLHHFEPWIDAPDLRYRRILVPAMAFTAAGGASELVDVAYRGVILAWILLGAYWVARYAQLVGRSVTWGLGFLLIPSVLLSAELMTIDVALTAICAGIAAHARRRSVGAMLVLLALAGLARETGLLLVVAAVVHAAWTGKRRQAVAYAAAALPALGWFSYVALRLPLRPYPFSWRPFSGLLGALLFPQSYPEGHSDWLSRHWQDVTQAADRVAILGIAAAVMLALWGLRRSFRSESGVVTLAAALFSVQCAFHNVPPDAWQAVENYARVYSPLLLVVALDALAERQRLGLVPPLLPWPRLGLGLLGALRAIRHGILG